MYWNVKQYIVTEYVLECKTSKPCIKIQRWEVF